MDGFSIGLIMTVQKNEGKKISKTNKKCMEIRRREREWP